jgi:Tol biopolymer transport system component
MGTRPRHAERPRIDPQLLENVLSSPQFVRSQRMCRFLKLLAERANQGNPEPLKETEIGVVVFDREVGYDPKLDSIVRTEANRLRRKLSEYYAGEGRSCENRLHLPLGRYELEVHRNLQPLPAIQPEAPPAAARSQRLLYVAAVVVTVALTAVVLRLLAVRPAQVPVATPLTYFPGRESQPAFSPEGSRVAYVWDGENNAIPAVYVQGLNAETPVRLTHSTDVESAPVWSPDSKSIAYLRRTAPDRNEIRRVRVDSPAGDDVIAMIAASPDATPGMTWSPDGEWLATAEPGASAKFRLVLISPRTGERKVFLDTDGRTSYLRPAFSPDGRRIAFERSTDTAISDVYVAEFPSGKMRAGTSGHAELSGLAWGGANELIVASGHEGMRSSLWRVPIGGTPVRLTQDASAASFPAVSRDGKLLAFTTGGVDVNVWKRRLDEPDGSVVGSAWLAASGLDSSPQWSPDGSQVAFRSSRTGSDEVWMAAADGQAAHRLTHFGGPVTGSPRWSPDGKWIALDSRAGGNSNIYVVAATGGEPRRITPEESNESLASWSRDGRAIYYNSDSTGVRSMFRRSWNGSDAGPRELIREHACAGWESPDGRYLYYVHSPGEPGLFRTPISGGAEEAVLPTLTPGMWGSWAFGKGGIFFVDWTAPHRKDAWAQVREESGTVRRLFPVASPVAFDGSVAVSPDGVWLAYSQVDRSGSDIQLIRDWR